MAQFEPLLWERRPRRTPRKPVVQGVPPIDAGVEFAGVAALGRLGRLLLSDVETYLEFFALARQPVSRTETG